MSVMDLDALAPLEGRVLRRIDGPVVARICADGWFAFTPGAAVLQVFDAAGDVVDERSISVGRRSHPTPLLAVDPTGGRVAVAEIDCVRLLDRDGATAVVQHAAWKGLVGGDVAFDPSSSGRDRLWVVVPGAKATGLLRQPPSGVVLLVDARTGAVVDQMDLGDDHPEGYTMLVAPDRGVVLNGAYGQDGSRTWCLQTGGDAIEAQDLGWTNVASGFHPATGEILFMPHDDPDIEVRAWWTGELVGRCAGSDVFGGWDGQDDLEEEPDSYGYTGAFFDGDRLVASTWSDRWLVVDRPSGRPVGRLTVDAEECDAVTIEQVADGVLLCVGTSTLLVDVDVDVDVGA